MPLRRPDHGDEDLGEGLALEVMKRQRRAKGVAWSGRGRSPETASRPISRRRIGSFVEKSFKILKRQTFLSNISFYPDISLSEKCFLIRLNDDFKISIY